MGAVKAMRLAVATTVAAGTLVVGLISATMSVRTITEAVPADTRPTITRSVQTTRSLPFLRQDTGELEDEYTVVSGPGPEATATTTASPAPTEQAPGEDTAVLNEPGEIVVAVVKKVVLAQGQLLSMPVQGPITSTFGMRLHPILGVYKLHTGTDFGVACGTPVGASAPGTVISAGWAGGNGVQVVIDHGQLGGHHIRTTYNHLSAIGVRPGQRVNTGDGVGLVGNTGYSTGCHLHFEVIANGSFTDPMPWLNGKAVIIDISGMKTVVMADPSPSQSPSPSPSASPSPSPSPSPSLSPSPSTCVTLPSASPSANPSPTPCQSSAPPPSSGPPSSDTSTPATSPSVSEPVSTPPPSSTDESTPPSTKEPSPTVSIPPVSTPAPSSTPPSTTPPTLTAPGATTPTGDTTP